MIGVAPISNPIPASRAHIPATKLRVLIADDEQLSRDRLKRFLHDEPNIELVSECSNGLEAVRAIRRNAPDIAFLDVRMPELDAFGVIDCLKNEPRPAIVLVTAHDQFALRAFEIDAVDYLLKPFDRPRFRSALHRAQRRVSASIPLERLSIHSRGHIILIKTSDIHWISAADNYVELHLANKSHLLRTPLSTLASKLCQTRFARISRSLIVNLDSVKEIRPRSHGDYHVVLHNGTNLSGSRNYRQSLTHLLGIKVK